VTGKELTPIPGRRPGTCVSLCSSLRSAWGRQIGRSRVHLSSSRRSAAGSEVPRPAGAGRIRLGEACSSLRSAWGRQIGRSRVHLSSSRRSAAGSEVARPAGAGRIRLGEADYLGARPLSTRTPAWGRLIGHSRVHLSSSRRSAAGAEVARPAGPGRIRLGEADYLGARPYPPYGGMGSANRTPPL